MDSIVNKLTEIEDAASAIVKHAEEQKEVLNREYDEKKRAFDHDLDEKTNARLNQILRQRPLRFLKARAAQVQS